MLLAAALAFALAAPPAPAASVAPPTAPGTATPTPTPTAPSTASPTPEGQVIEEIVAVVRNPPSAPPRVVTLTKLLEEARIALVSRGATEAAIRPLDRAALRAALEWLLDQMLVADEAAKLRLDELDRDAVHGELRRFQARFATFGEYERFLARSELSEDELAATLARMLRVERYVQSRVGGSARVGDDEVDRWLSRRGAADASATARGVVRTQLAEDKARAQVRELLSELRSRAEIRIVGQLGHAQPERSPL